MQTFTKMIAFTRSKILIAFSCASGKKMKDAVGFSALALVLLLFLISQMSQKTTFPMKPPIEITASQLSHEYAVNKVAAEQKFQGNIVKITGIVQQVTIEDDDLAVMLGGVDSRKSVVARFGRQQKEKAPQIHLGNVVALFCAGAKMVNGNPALRNCQIVG